MAISLTRAAGKGTGKPPSRKMQLDSFAKKLLPFFDRGAAAPNQEIGDVCAPTVRSTTGRSVVPGIMREPGIYIRSRALFSASHISIFPAGVLSCLRGQRRLRLLHKPREALGIVN